VTDSKQFDELNGRTDSAFFGSESKKTEQSNVTVKIPESFVTLFVPNAPYLPGFGAICFNSLGAEAYS
jgi:hypothetical protein